MLLDWLDPAYPLLVLRGAQDAARERGVSLVCYTVGLPGPGPVHEWPAHRVIGPESIQGIIVLGSGTELHGDPTLEPPAQLLSSLPQCFVAGERAGSSSVWIDDESGIFKPVEHLVKVHACRRIAYIGGPQARPSSGKRLAGFRAAVAALGLELDPRLILPGDFTVPAGRRAVQTLLDERGVSIQDVDAVVAANDGMAWGCMEALAERGIRVPWELAVTGFDDVAAGRQAQVPLTTVRQPVRQLGRVAAEQLLAQIGGAAPKQILLDTELVTRRSCGCLEGVGQLPLTAADLQQRGGRSFEAALLERREPMIAEMRRAGRGQLGGLDSGWELRMVTALVDEIRGRSPDAFRLALDDTLGRVVATGDDPTVLHGVATALWRHLIPCVLADPGLRTAVEGVLDCARLAIGAAGMRAQVAEQVANEARAWQLVDACIALTASASAEELAAVVEERLPALGVSRLAVGLFAGGRIGNTLRCVLSLQEGEARVERADIRPKQFAGRTLPPSGRADLIVSGLGSSPTPFGLVCMELVPASQLVHDGLREALTRAFQRLRRDGRRSSRTGS
jgi:sigma-B regulation protein RsbU (phosphoserine phosphatase)